MSIQDERKQIERERPLEKLLTELKEVSLVAPGVALKDVALFLGFGSDRTAAQCAVIEREMRKWQASPKRIEIPLAVGYRPKRPNLIELTNAQLCLRARELHTLLKQMEDAFGGRPGCEGRAQAVADAAAIALELERRLRTQKGVTE